MFFLPYKTQLPVLFHVRFTALEELESNLFALVLIQKKKKFNSDHKFLKSKNVNFPFL